ncbi:helix-turn-helix transcriptional regulator [Geothrix sp. 21YS21S-4]|uniref:ArsR/SmtB family transcription factor n=1 Tax=Geothrix sp. 21YS21S-4 TaxID=3068889 RepID=UPI0027BAE7F4|nr:metalloregulator ArsR/SmtB family transcription factor [Geothrix sp. 21YS21S-4]
METAVLPPEPIIRQLKALAHRGRLAVVRAVVQGPEEGTPAGQIQALVEMPASTVSHHLADLAEAGLLRASREGTTIRYAVRFDQLRALTDYLWQDCCGGGCRDANCP